MKKSTFSSSFPHPTPTPPRSKSKIRRNEISHFLPPFFPLSSPDFFLRAIFPFSTLKRGREERKINGFLSLLLITQAAYARMQRGKEEEGPSSSSPRKGEGGRLLKAKRGKGKRELERRRRMSLHHSLFPFFAPPAAAAKRRKGMQGNRRLGFDKGFFSVSIVGHNCFD